MISLVSQNALMALPRTLHSATEFQLEALNFLENPHKDIAVLRSYPTVKQLFVHFNAVLPSSPMQHCWTDLQLCWRYHSSAPPKYGGQNVSKIVTFEWTL